MTVSISENDSKSEKKKETKSKTGQGDKIKSNTKSTNPSKDTLKDERETATSVDTAQAAEDCKIKGSENGIYHTPGSTYYSRTKNVAQRGLL